MERIDNGSNKESVNADPPVELATTPLTTVEDPADLQVRDPVTAL